MMDELKFQKPEPDMYNVKLLKLDMKVESSEHIAWRIEKQHYDNFNSISKEQRQDILNIFRKGDITIKEVGEKLGIDSMIVADVVYLNIHQISLLRDDSL